MRAQEHSQYEVEQQNLENTLTIIKAGLSSEYSGGFAYRSVEKDMRKLFEETRHDLREAYEKAYIGRVDIEEEGKTITYYIGKYHIPGTNIYSWAARMPGEWYFGSNSPEILLKRELGINHRNLLTINDLYVHPSLSDQLVAGKFSDSLLSELLKQNKTGQLHDIVATIQEQQYNIIQSPLNQLLIIQGAAGSGKSSIALHRVAYLLFNNKNQLKNVLVLGPNRMFMGYVAGLLPSLGERSIVQKSVDDWLIEKLEKQVEYESIDRSIEMFLSPQFSQARKIIHFRNSQLKGSLKMASLLEQYVQTLDTPPSQTAEPLICEIIRTSAQKKIKSVATAQCSHQEIMDLLTKYSALPLYKKRDEVENILVSVISREVLKKIKEDMKSGGIESQVYEGDVFADGIKQEVAQKVGKYFSTWRKNNVLTVYRKLFRDTDLLHKAGQGIFDSSELDSLAQETTKPFKFSDLPALVYLKILLEGTGEDKDNKIDHLVIDESQDLSPLNFKVLSHYMRTNSMTILGDIAQGIYTHSGIQKWEELEDATSQQVHIEEIKQTYRSTQEITKYANSLLRRIGVSESSLAEPIARPGPSPTTQQFSNSIEAITEIKKLVMDEQSRGNNSIAIVFKTAESCKRLAGQFQAEGFNDFHLLIDRNANFPSGVAIIPTYLTKGLEFDSVIIADADAGTYPADELSSKLLYVALTRASHTLHICHTGTISPLLDSSIPYLRLESTLPIERSQAKVTIAEYIEKNRHLDLTECIEYLASREKLYLLVNGKVDELILDSLLLDRSSEISDRANSISRSTTITENMVKNWVVNVTSQSDDDYAQEQIALVELVNGFASSQPKSKKQKNEKAIKTPLLDKALYLTGLYYSVQNRALTIKPKWIESDEITQFFDPSQAQKSQKLIVKLIDQGLIEEEIGQEQIRMRIPPDSFKPLLELIILQFDKVKDLA